MRQVRVCHLPSVLALNWMRLCLGQGEGELVGSVVATLQVHQAGLRGPTLGNTHRPVASLQVLTALSFLATRIWRLAEAPN